MLVFLTVLKTISLIIAIWFSMVNMGNIFHGRAVGHYNLAIQSIALALYIML
jgi:hypothetical protein